MPGQPIRLLQVGGGQAAHHLTAAGRPAQRGQCLRHLVPGPVKRVKRSGRILEDNRQLAAAQPGGPVRVAGQLAAFEFNPTSHEFGAGRQQPQNGQNQQGLAGAGFAAKAHDFTVPDLQVQSAQDLLAPAGRPKRHPQTGYLEPAHRDKGLQRSELASSVRMESRNSVLEPVL
ncbi:MAG: hypothetical protein BWY73_00674 [candidate division TA06 bacterium ADurb.Bin417]|uniref:Uncharacterized protein n=1 Tax=candidate division TA06 bacterium ADurb.Bin417 TaxID=1852828 RepID=A0A1V5MIG5_UNCT6|nr:MAG: hypothetical protein BWY73_00674 [candidate division TA06 bacterium ADurb.Bin417]